MTTFCISVRTIVQMSVTNLYESRRVKDFHKSKVAHWKITTLFCREVGDTSGKYEYSYPKHDGKTVVKVKSVIGEEMEEIGFCLTNQA